MTNHNSFGGLYVFYREANTKGKECGWYSESVVCLFKGDYNGKM